MSKIVVSPMQGFRFPIESGITHAKEVYAAMKKQDRDYVQKNVMADFRKAAKKLGFEVVVNRPERVKKEKPAKKPSTKKTKKASAESKKEETSTAEKKETAGATA